MSEQRPMAAGETAEPGAGLRRWMPWFVTGIAVLAFCASLWIAYRSGSPALPGGEAPLVRAEPQPLKVRPASEDAAGQPDPQIYGPLAKTAPQTASPPPVTTKLAPGPEKPVARPVPPETAPPSSLPQVSALHQMMPVDNGRTAPETAGVRSEGERERLELTPQKPQSRHSPTARPGVTLSLPTAPAPPVPPPAPPAQAAKPESVKPAPPQPAAQEPARAAGRPAGSEVAALAAIAPAAGGRLVQLGAYRSEAEAQGVWDRLKVSEAPLLGALKPRVVRADLGEKGVFYRLQLGPLADDAAARGLCRELSARKQACFVVPAG